MALRYLTQKLSQEIDKELMSPQGGFCVEQLMELAGLSVAQAVTRVYSKDQYSRVLVCVGPGNNGGDGLVAARHLLHFGYKPKIYLPKEPSKDLYKGLVTQCKNLHIPFTKDIASQIGDSDLVLDAIFGFGFSGDVRAPYDEAVKCLKQNSLPIVSIDCPSGWDVEHGNAEEKSFEPEMLISLTAPKLCAKHFRGRYHFLGGRFVPPEFEKKYELNLPQYPGTDQCVDISSRL
ncbi:uncharacterized protein VTP21DRAFT_7561 [Calcarisporiella thermophila]|uniref:uncharacterized protein n=1 Tax=Calcarisporiella thermophila TaxID=911321 RepID=UPI00374215C0